MVEQMQLLGGNTTRCGEVWRRRHGWHLDANAHSLNLRTALLRLYFLHQTKVSVKLSR